MRDLTSRCLVLSAALAAGACGDTTAPAVAFGGRYALSAVGGAALPAPVATGGYITSGSLDATAPDSLRVLLTSSWPELGAPPDRLTTFAFRRAGDSLVVAGPAGMGGQIEPQSVRLRLAFQSASRGGYTFYWYDLTFRR